MNYGIGFNKERKLGWVNKAVEGNSKSRDVEAKGQVQGRSCPLAQEL